jgi:class 3 adenylate cyclase
MADLPSGAITFLFTDIEGSTRLVKQLRDRYGEVLAEHQRLLRDAFRAHGGHEVDTQGDSFFVAFTSARDALLAAVEGQLALLSHPWPDGVQVKVRMGLHTGQAVATGGRNTGLAVHRAARIQSFIVVCE